MQLRNNNDSITNQTYHILIPSNIDKLSNCHYILHYGIFQQTNKKPDERIY